MKRFGFVKIHESIVPLCDPAGHIIAGSFILRMIDYANSPVADPLLQLWHLLYPATEDQLVILIQIMEILFPAAFFSFRYRHYFHRSIPGVSGNYCSFIRAEA